MCLPERDFPAGFFSCRFHQVELVQVEYCTEEVLHRLSRGLNCGRIVSHVWVTFDESGLVLKRLYQFARGNQGKFRGEFRGSDGESKL